MHAKQHSTVAGLVLKAMRSSWAAPLATARRSDCRSAYSAGLPCCAVWGARSKRIMARWLESACWVYGVGGSRAPSRRCVAHVTKQQLAQPMHCVSLEAEAAVRSS